jgi:hypothetical protein
VPTGHCRRGAGVRDFIDGSELAVALNDALIGCGATQRFKGPLTNVDDDRPMRFLIGPIVVLCMLCGWDAYSNHGKITRDAMRAASDIARRVF